MHADAALAAEASVEVHRQKGNDGFWKFHAMLFQHQQEPDGLKRTALEGYAEQLGLNMQEFRAALEDHRHKSVVDTDVALAGEKGIRGTPTAVVNDQLVKGAVGFDKYRRVIDGLLGR
jgi:protein-disulfide isomerase